MRRLRNLIILAAASLCVSAAALLQGCHCGFDCNNGNSRGTTTLKLGFSDSLPEDLKKVVLEVDSITLRSPVRDDVVVDQFTIPDLGLVDADTFQVDLLKYPGRNQLVVIDGLELVEGNYDQIDIKVLGGDVNHSYVLDADDTQRELSVPGGTLSVTGAQLAAGEQSYTVEFGLALSLQELDSGASYQMDPVGVQLENDTTAASLSGRVDSALFDSVPPCDAKDDPTQGNRIYLYEGVSLSGAQLGDVYRDSSSTAIPDNAVAPFAVAALAYNALTASWEYAFGFLPAGDYTVAFACDTAGDDSVNFDDLAIPLPSDQVYEISLSEGESAACDLTSTGGC